MALELVDIMSLVNRLFDFLWAGLAVLSLGPFYPNLLDYLFWVSNEEILAEVVRPIV